MFGIIPEKFLKVFGLNNNSDFNSIEKIAFDEMMVHVLLCTHKEPSNVFIEGEVSENFKKEINKHDIKPGYGDIAALNAKNEKELDIIIITSESIDEMVLANIERSLKDDGILVFPTSNFGKDKEKLKSDLTMTGKNFWITMPYSFRHQSVVLASKKYHPTADIVLQRSDLLDGLTFYSTEVHHASFVYPRYIHEELTGIAKR